MATVCSCDFRTARVGGVHCTMPRRRENWGWLAFSLFRLTVHTHVCVCVNLASLPLADGMACETGPQPMAGGLPYALERARRHVW